MPLDNNATLRQILDTQKSITGMNQEPELRSAIRKHGVSVEDSDNMSTMVYKLNEARIKPPLAIDNSKKTTELYTSYMDKNKYVLENGNYYEFTTVYPEKKAFRSLFDRNGSLISKDYVIFENTNTPSYSFVYVDKDMFYVYHSSGSTHYISSYSVHTLNLIKSEISTSGLTIGWGMYQGVNTMVNNLVYCVNEKYVFKVDPTDVNMLSLYNIKGSFIRGYTTTNVYGAVFLCNEVILISYSSNARLYYISDGSVSANKGINYIIQLIACLFGKFNISLV